MYRRQRPPNRSPPGRQKNKPRSNASQQNQSDAPSSGQDLTIKPNRDEALLALLLAKPAAECAA
jgi:hypothetical protein